MKLLAPNGKPSNLTPEQWHLVRTPEFKSVYGDWEKLSLVKRYDSGIDIVSLSELEKNVKVELDSNGEPLLTPQVKSEIRKVKNAVSKKGGIFLVSNKERAAYMSVIVILGFLLAYQYYKK